MYPNAAGLPEFQSSPWRAVQSVVSTPQWPMNLLWLTIAVLLQSVFIGQIALLGYAVDLFRARSGRPENPTPDISADRFGDYIEQGIWPFVVLLVTQLALAFVLSVPLVVIAILVSVLVASLGPDGQTIASIGIALLVPLCWVLIAVVNVCTVPFLIRSIVCRDFAQSFDFAWAREFLRLMFWEMFWSGIRMLFLTIGLAVLGLLLLCVGYLPALGWISGAWIHLLAQWYERYLSLGGDPVTFPDDEIIEATLS